MSNRFTQWLAHRPSIEIINDIYRTVHKAKPYEPIEPAYDWTVIKIGKHQHTFTQYWTGKLVNTSRTSDNRWTTLPHKARRFHSEATARYVMAQTELFREFTGEPIKQTEN